MEIFQSILLGIIQGIAEFLPISSTAHLILIPKFFEFQDPGLSFDVALHLGTLIAVMGYFWKDWMEIFKLAFKKNYELGIMNYEKQKDKILGNYGKNILWLLIIATVPGVLAGYFLEEKAETVFRSPLLIAATLAGAGLVLYLSDKFFQHRKKISEISLLDSIIIGILQAVAIIPGVSRSGATIIGGLWRGLSREGAARFSFLLSTPIIFGAVIKQSSDFFQGGINLPVFLGILSSAVSGYLAIKYLLQAVDKWGYSIFFWYRLILAGIIIFWLI